MTIYMLVAAADTHWRHSITFTAHYLSLFLYLGASFPN